MRTKSLGVIAALVVGLAAVMAALAATSAPAKTTRASADELVGAGSSFVAPLVSQWQKDYEGKTGVKITYSPIGSGGGISAISNRTVDFGASDAPLSPDQFSACKGCVQIPWALSATSIAYNLPNVPNNLKMTGPVLADIYLGTIKKWNDQRIKSLNPKVDLPDTDITPVYRSDASGTTFNFTDYLSTVSPNWKSKVGNSTQVNFPLGVGARGSSGVAGVVSRTTGALTYVDVAYALANKIKFMSVKNKAGKYASPGLRGISAASSLVTKVPAGNAISIVDPPATKKTYLAYPICTFTYIILPQKTDKAQLLRRFVFYALTTGQTFGPKLLFVPIPKVVLVAAEKTLKQVTPNT
jgi:phosphate transport system substrate-binding protein